jgi:lipopolysaccharide transport system ATP-binding protein
MSDTVIKVENISKRYRLGLKEKKADTFAQQMVNVLKYPIDNFRRIQNLGKFGAEEEGVHWALKDVSFEVKQGDVLGIIGKNGAGKSTLLKILSKITEPTSGRIEVNGRIAALLEVGTGFHPELSGRENIYMNGTILGMTRREIDKKLDEIIDFSGVEKFIDTPIKFYSSGMKVRLGFSVAAHLEPEILVIDEVLAVGDYEFQQKCLGKMEEVSKGEGRTVLFVSHNLNMMRTLCKHSVLLKGGKFQDMGNTDHIISTYLSSGNLNQVIFTNSAFEGTGNKSLEFTEIKTVGRQGSEIFSNEYFAINVGYKVNRSENLLAPRIDIRIDDKFGQRLIWFTSKENPTLEWKSGQILFEIDKLPLIEGEYQLTIYASDGVETSDWYKNIMAFKVENRKKVSGLYEIPNDQTYFICNYQVTCG